MNLPSDKSLNLTSCLTVEAERDEAVEADSLAFQSSSLPYLSRHLEDETSQKKTKKKARRQRTDSQLNGSLLTSESETNIKTLPNISGLKMKKRKRSHDNKQNGGDKLYVAVNQGNTSSTSKAEKFENIPESPSALKKKRVKGKSKKANCASAEHSRNRTSSTSLSKRGEFDRSGTEDTQVQFITSSFLSPLHTPHSNLSQIKRAEMLWLDTPAVLGSPVTHKKHRKDKKLSANEGSDTDRAAKRSKQTAKSVANRDGVKHRAQFASEGRLR